MTETDTNELLFTSVFNTNYSAAGVNFSVRHRHALSCTVTNCFRPTGLSDGLSSLSFPFSNMTFVCYHNEPNYHSGSPR